MISLSTRKLALSGAWLAASAAAAMQPCMAQKTLLHIMNEYIQYWYESYLCITMWSWTFFMEALAEANWHVAWTKLNVFLFHIPHVLFGYVMTAFPLGVYVVGLMVGLENGLNLVSKGWNTQTVIDCVSNLILSANGLLLFFLMWYPFAMLAKRACGHFYGVYRRAVHGADVTVDGKKLQD